MRPPVGHVQTRAILERELPPVALVLGPRSVGKWTLGEYLVAYHRVLPVDTLRVPSLTSDGARAVRTFLGTAPFGALKVVLIRLDRASDGSLNVLLKTLEEPPPSARFILVSSDRTLATIVSRSHLFRVGLLAPEEVREVLRDHLGMADPTASRLAPLGGGTIVRALNSQANDAHRSLVITLGKAVADQDRSLLDRALRSWNDEAIPLFERYLLEARTGLWSVFSESETFGLTSEHRDRLDRLLQVWSRLPATRPKLRTRVTLETLVPER
jgi:DNA polymerase III delta prime subunit